MQKLIAGNWKMNGLADSILQARAIAEGTEAFKAAVSVMICPPATLVARMADEIGSSAVRIGAQDCHWDESGAHTGDVSAEMLADAGAGAVIVGHSERRTDHGETDADVLAKARAAHRAGLTAIICVGETEAERDAGQAESVVEAQLEGSVPDTGVDRIVVAYEPVWAIGTGRTPSAGDISAMHRHIRDWLIRRFPAGGAEIEILYGGSMKPGNALEILAIENVDGGLIGGASLVASDFLSIIGAAAENAR